MGSGYTKINKLTVSKGSRRIPRINRHGLGHNDISNCILGFEATYRTFPQRVRKGGVFGISRSFFVAAFWWYRYGYGLLDLYSLIPHSVSMAKSSGFASLLLNPVSSS
jgi:hypothetical protein